MKNITLSIIVLLFSLTSISQQIISVSPNLSYDFINTANSNLVSPDIIYTVGSGKATGQTEFIPWTMRSVNGGVNWNVFKKNNLYYMVFFNKDTALALTNRLYDNNSKYYTVISSTKNNFTNYDSIVLDSNAYNVDLIKGNNCIYLTFRTYAQPDSQATYRSDNFGESWKKVFNSFILNTRFISDSVGYGKYWDEASQKNIQIKTSDNGLNWEIVPVTYPGYEYFDDVIFDYSFVDFAPLKKGFNKSHDEGKTWEEINRGLPDGFIAGYNLFWRTNLFSFYDKNTGFTYDPNFGLYKTIDGGKNWSLLWNDFQMKINDIHFLKHGKKFYFLFSNINKGSSDMYYGMFDSLDIWSSVEAEARLTNNIQVYPNPAKEEINIQTSGFFNMNTSIRVYDAAGKQVLETKLQIPQTTIDISGLDKGIYFIKILNGNGEFVEKLIKE
jgi:hypothetical protein